MPLARRTGLVLVAASLLGAVVLAALPLPASASTTTLRVLSGSAAVVHGGTGRPATDGEALASGDEVATGPDGHALLAFVDGSTLTLDPGTRVAIDEVSAHPGATVTRLAQSLGRTWSSVQRLVSARSRYEIRTPAVTATVRGTAFEVDVAVDGTTRVRTVEGAVRVVNDLGEVLVIAGTQTTAAPAGPPAPPSTPAPTTLRTLEIGEAPIVVVDEAGRSCGRRNEQLLQQIPGCVVRDGQIRITGASPDERLIAVTTAPTADQPIVERVIAPGPTAAAVVREVDVATSAEVPRVTVVTPRPQPPAPTQVNLPLIGRVPVQPAALATPVPVVSPAPSASVPVVLVPSFSLPPLPTFAPRPSLEPVETTAPAAPTVPAFAATPPPIPFATVLPTVVATIAPTALPRVVPTATPAAPSPAIPTIAPSIAPSLAPIPAATPTPTPTVAPTTQTPAPTAPATLTPTPTPLVPLPSVGLP